MAGLTTLVLGGMLLAWFSRNFCFLWMWTTLIQMVFTIYLSLSIGPVITDWFTHGTTDNYYYAAIVLLLAIVLFWTMHVVTRQTMSGIKNIALPHSMDSVISIILGFCCGVLTTSFLLAIFCITPLSRTTLVEHLSGEQPLERTGLPPVRIVCKGVGYLSFQTDPWATRNMLHAMVTRQHSNE